MKTFATVEKGSSGAAAAGTMVRPVDPERETDARCVEFTRLDMRSKTAAGSNKDVADPGEARAMDQTSDHSAGQRYAKQAQELAGSGKGSFLYAE